MGYQPFPSPRDHPNPGIEPRSPVLQMDSLSTEPQGKPQNTGVGSLCLLQRIFPTQESNQGLLHCRRILYQLSYQGTNHIIQQLHSQTYISEKWKLMSIQRKLSFFFFFYNSFIMRQWKRSMVSQWEFQFEINEIIFIYHSSHLYLYVQTLQK